MNKFEEKDLWWQDRFELCDEHAYWLYYNPDGNDGNGQAVEVCICPEDVPLNAVSEDEFWDHLSSVCKTYLHDREDEDFDAYVNALLEKKDNSDFYRNNSTPDTMQWLIDWAKRYV